MQPNMKMIQQMQNRMMKIQQELEEAVVEGTAGGGVVKVEVSGQPTDNALRRNSTASKIVIGREELLRFGDGNLADLMRRLPGVTPTGRPGRGGGVAMRGMGGGFTQILVNGERMAPGPALPVPFWRRWLS